MLVSQTSDLKKLTPLGLKVEGEVELSFVLPISLTDEATVIALSYVEKLGLKDPLLIETESVGKCWSRFKIVAHVQKPIDVSQPKLQSELSKQSIVDQGQLKASLKGVLPILAVSIHAEDEGWIDQIATWKNQSAHWGLESYAPHVKVHRFRWNHFSVVELLDQLMHLRPQVLLVFLGRAPAPKKLKESLQEISKSSMMSGVFKILMSKKILPKEAEKIGFDKGFIGSVTPDQLLAWVVEKMASR